MSSPRITVLMTLYNGGRYLEQSIRSVLNQTHQDFEFLIVEDCSTDGSGEVAESFRDRRIKIHRNQSNMGQTRSLNVGLKLAAGEYIARIDADDVAFPLWLERQWMRFQRYPDYSVISTYVTAIDEHNHITKVYRRGGTEEELILRSFVASPINHVGSIFKKEDVLACGGYDEQYRTAADYDLWGKLLRSGKKITATPQFLVAIREHAGSLSRLARGKRELTEIIDIAQKNINAFCGAKYTDLEAERMCQAHYLPESLTMEQFQEAIRLAQSMYAKVQTSGGITQEKGVWWGRKQIRTLYFKRIFALIAQKDYSAVRETAGKGVRDFGPLSIFTILFILSLLGNIFLSPLPKIYKAILERKARLQLDGRIPV